MARLDPVLSFSRGDPEDETAAAEDQPEASAAVAVVASYDTGSSDDDDDDAEFEFAFAPPLGQEEDAARLLAPADDLFAHGRILPAYPVFERGQNPRVDAVAPHRQTLTTQAAASTAPHRQTYCAWAPRSAPGSPARERDFKSASTGEARSFWRGLVSGRSHSDGKEKFVFLQHTGDKNNPAAAAPSKMPLQEQRQKQSNKKPGAEMDMATAHRLFYGKKKKKKQGALPGAADRKQHSSYLPYRTGIVGFFATAHALGRSHHPF